MVQYPVFLIYIRDFYDLHLTLKNNGWNHTGRRTDLLKNIKHDLKAQYLFQIIGINEKRLTVLKKVLLNALNELSDKNHKICELIIL